MRVLIVDDDARLVEAITRGLQAEGIFADCAFDGEEGLFKGQEGSYDAIILDLTLPAKHGYEVCQQLRNAHIWAPILILTAQRAEAEEARALNLGADDFLGKPFSYTVLVARLRALVRRGNGPRPTTMRVGDLELDPTRRQCWRGDTAVHLTEREFSLLELLMRRSGEVLPKQRIVDHVWGFDFDGDWNVVEVYIGYLRKKVDSPFGRHTIQTVRGAGYRLLQEAL